MNQPTLSRIVCIIFVFCAATAIASPAQVLTVLHSFNGTDGAYPYAGLVQGSDGNFYGTTNGGGAYNDGTVFKMTPSGALTMLYSFAGYPNDGSNPYAGLVQASAGNLYGTTCCRGTNDGGTVFKITPSGALTTLYSFCSQSNCSDGAAPYAGLVQGSDGNFYGTTTYGGTYNGCGGTCGTVFKITSGGTLTTLYSFCSQSNCSDGARPYAGLVQASDGNFYGTTEYGAGSSYCLYGCGTVFKITPSGALTTLHSFDYTDGALPGAGLIQATDGNFYGTASYGGDVGYGTVFKITPSGALTTLYSFCSQTNCSDGALPEAGLVQARDGSFYGTTEYGGTSGNC